MSREINEKASLLGRMLTHLQIGGERKPLPLARMQVQLIHKVSGELLELMDQAPAAGTFVEMDTRLGDNASGLLAEFMGGETPDTIPEDWDNEE